LQLKFSDYTVSHKYDFMPLLISKRQLASRFQNFQYKLKNMIFELLPWKVIFDNWVD